MEIDQYSLRVYGSGALTNLSNQFSKGEKGHVF